MSEWKKVKLKDVLKQYRNTHWVEDKNYKQVTISQTGEVSYRGTKHGSQIGRKRQFIIDLKNHPNTLIFIRQGVYNGGIGICPKEVDGCIVTENMPMFEIVGINPEYLVYYLRSPQFKRDVDKLVPLGTAQKAVHEKQLLELEIFLPSLKEQEQIIKRVKSNYENISELNNLNNKNEDYISKLRQQILKEAVKGRLVKQDPKDESASELLKKIKAEKDKLVKEGKIRKEKPLSPINEDEIPYELPRGWEWVRLNELVSILGDGLHGTPAYSNDEDYFFINGNNLDNGKIVIKPNTKKVSFKEYEKYRKDLTERSILVSINGTLGNVAFYNNERVILGKSACYFNLLSKIDKDYIKLLITSPHFLEYVLKSATRTTIDNVSLQSMRLLPVPLPPFLEQKRIVEKVDRLIVYCDELENQVKENKGNSEKLMVAVLKESFQN